MSISGFIFGAFVLVLVSIPLIKLVPAYLQDIQIKNVFVSIAHDPEMQKATPRDIQAAFGKQATMDNITAIKATDIEMSSEDGKLFLSANYSTKIHVGGNISLYLEFNPTSAGK
jgi:hypothetical protein